MEKLYIIIFGVLIYIIFLYYLRLYTMEKSIKKNSLLYKGIVNVNKKYITKFKTIKSNYNYYYRCQNLRNYQKCCNKDFAERYFLNLIKENLDSWKDLYDTLVYNISLQNKYFEEIRFLKNTYLGKCYQEVNNQTILLSEKQYIEKEGRMCKSLKLQPVVNLKLKLFVEYTSPAGKNHYSGKFSINENDIKRILEAIKEKNEYHQMTLQNQKKEKIRFKYVKRFQRSLMTKSKRYDILKRDNFKCRICGRGPEDGVKLEVDHIIPISRGGKTINSNLQTLCQDCNRGKKDKV